MRLNAKTIFRWSFSLLAMVLLAPPSVPAADIGNCLLCHKYPGLSRIDEDGRLRLLFINEATMNSSVHARVKCEDCHTDIKKIPHDPAKKVDCLTQCHIVEPTSEQKFSHREVARFLSKSVHGLEDRDQKPKKHPEDLPSCKDCHDNPLYRPLSIFKQKVHPGISKAALGRCRVCHKKDEFIYRFYNHVTTRLHKIRSPKNIAEICARCHDDAQLAARHGLSTKAVYSYGETFHGKAALFLDERVPDCLDCHVNPGRSVHQMLSYKDPNAITNENNKGLICANMDCHPGASPKLAEYRVHPEFDLERNPYQFYAQVFFLGMTGSVLLPIMGLLFLDLLRRMFPNASLRRRK